MNYHEIVATEDSVSIVRLPDGDFTNELPANHCIATKYAVTIMPKAEYEALVNQYTAWEPGQTVTAGTKRMHEGQVYLCVQSHTTQSDWQPEYTPALWNCVPADGTIWHWAQPLGAHDAYPLGFVVHHGGKEWESLIAANVWAPGSVGAESLWLDLSEPEQPEQPAEWVQPTGGHDAYKIGDKVTFQGKVYESLINGNVWSPAVYPAGWKLGAV